VSAVWYPTTPQVDPDLGNIIYFYPRELAKLRGYIYCFVVAVACLLVLYSIKQFVKLPLQHGSHARMQFGILPLHQGYDHVQAYSVVTYNVFWYKTYTFLRSSANSVICQ
jgi:hypothetical protein